MQCYVYTCLMTLQFKFTEAQRLVVLYAAVNIYYLVFVTLQLYMSHECRTVMFDTFRHKDGMVDIFRLDYFNGKLVESKEKLT